MLNLARKFSGYSSNGFFITTPIYYANASPHLGHLYSSLIADTINRYQKISSHHSENIFSTGTDEHGIKVLQAAKNEPVLKYCDTVSEKYKKLFQASGINFTDYIRTTEDRHKRAVEKFWNVLRRENVIYKDFYAGWYCVQDETFLTESQLATDNDGKKTSLESGHPVEWSQEENYMFKLKEYQEDVIYWAKQLQRVVPNKFHKILLDTLHNEELPNISVSRPSSRMTWGIPVPDDPTQNIYVWLDALTNYLTVSGYPDKMTLWPPNIQVIGKDILKFHGIYWPAFLIAANIEPPHQLLVHSHWTVDGQKMSKSRQNVVDPMEKSKLYTFEGIRYFLLREGVSHKDGNFSENKIVNILNAELADSMGNLLSRACGKSLNPEQKFPAIDFDQLNDLIKTDACKVLIEKMSELHDKCRCHYCEFNFHLVVDSVISTLHSANAFFESSKPWELKKNDEEWKRKKLDTIISITLESLRISGIVLQPIIPDYSTRLLNRLTISPELRFWKDTKMYFRKTAHDLTNLESNILFKKIQIEEKVEVNNKKQKA